MAGTLTKGIKLSYKASSSSSSYTDLTNLQEIPDLGGSADSVEVTTLDDAAHMYINGLKDYGDSLDFTFLYVKAQFDTERPVWGERLESHTSGHRCRNVHIQRRAVCKAERSRRK